MTDKLCAQQTVSLLSEKPGGFFDSRKKIVPGGDDFFVRRAEGVCWSPSAMEKTGSPPRLAFLIPGKRKMPWPTPLTHHSRTKHQKAPLGACFRRISLPAMLLRSACLLMPPGTMALIGFAPQYGKAVTLHSDVHSLRDPIPAALLVCVPLDSLRSSFTCESIVSFFRASVNRPEGFWDKKARIRRGAGCVPA